MNDPLRVTDTLILTNRDTHKGPTFIHVYVREDRSFLVISYRGEWEIRRKAYLSRLPSFTSVEGLRVARGQVLLKQEGWTDTT